METLQALTQYYGSYDEDNRLAEMDEDTFQLYLRYHFATCERIDMVGYSNHTLDIFRKD